MKLPKDTPAIYTKEKVEKARKKKVEADKKKSKPSKSK